ncbi:MAG TPA: decaprenyl-phosphate phosphoribosyltransferase [Vicinamibacterales bacterium]|nr:decaprenyl-phosphate phosphoribosyltransferase [Vicinamibacterales bacterium]
MSSVRPVQPAPAGAYASPRSLVVNLLLSLRPAQWTKNLVVFAGLIFGQELFVPGAVARATVAFAVFCALSGVVYLINDVGDRAADQRHPTKSRRPIASGALPVETAIAAAGVLGVAALGVSLWLSPAFAAIAAGYLALLSIYSATLKHHVILDVLTLSAGFVLRAAGGAVAVDVPVSRWLLLLTLLLALFLALSKRRAELVALADEAREHRPSLAEYSPYLLDQMISVVTASTLLAYAFYTISPDTVSRFGTEDLIFTVPFPLYGIFRYLYLVHRRDGGGNPSEHLLTDRPLLVCVALWGVAVIAILYGPPR